MSKVIQHQTRILLAEDNITNQQATLAVLENLGLRAHAVANGQEAIKALESMHYDLVLMDCQMPVLDGYKATRMIRNGQSKVHNQQVPIIAMTAHTVQSARELCLECGMDDFLPKPVLPQALVAILNKWLPQGWLSMTHLNPSACGAQPKKHTNPLPVWDREGMLTRLMGDGRVAQTIIDGFLSDQPLQIQDLEASLARGDVMAAKRLAHSIKGAAAIIGGERLQAVALTMEHSATTGHPTTLHTQIRALQLEFEILQQKIQQNPIQDEKE